MKRKLTRIIQKRGGWYVAYVKEVLGVNVQGKTLAEGRRNLDEALALIIAASRDLSLKQR